MADLLVFLFIFVRTILILSAIVFVVLLCVGLFSLNAHVTAAEYTAKTALKARKKKRQKEAGLPDKPSGKTLEDQEYEDLRGLYEMWYNGKWLIIWAFRSLCWIIWCIPPLFYLLPKPKKVFAEYQPPEDDEEDEPDNIPVDPNSLFFKIYRFFKGYEKGYLGTSTAFLLTRKSKISKGLGAATAASAAVQKKWEIDRKKQESEERAEREKRESEERAEREKLESLRKLEENLRIRAYPDEVPPVIGVEEEVKG